MGIRKALIVTNDSPHILFIKYKKQRSRGLGWVEAEDKAEFFVGDLAGHSNFTLNADSETSSDKWEDSFTGNFENFEWHVRWR